MKTTKTISGIHFVRASIAKKPGKEEITQAIQRANKNLSSITARIHEPSIYTR